jgi:hypothetical protein
MITRVIPFLLLPLSVTALGCTSFATVRSARVHPGASVTLQGAISAPPGDEAAWFWSFDCAFECNHAIGGVDLSIAFGYAGGNPFAVGAGVNGVLYPYLEGYIQLSQASRPFGIGGRFGPPLSGWTEHQVYARYDIPLGPGRYVLLNPAIFYHTGNSPNGAQPGHFLAYVQGVGLLLEGSSVSITPAVALVLGRGKRESFSPETFSTAFGAVSVSITFHRKRRADEQP